EVVPEPRERLADIRDHPLVVRPRLAARTGRAEVLVQALTAPGALDEQDLPAEVVADDVTELQFGAEVVLAAVGREARPKRPRLEGLLRWLIPHPHAVSRHPAALVIGEVLDELRLRGVLQ